MISRGLSSGKVCLGCRLRLLHQVNRPNISQAISRSPAVHWPRVQRWFASEASASTDEPGWKPNREALSALDKSSETDEQSYQRFLKEEDVTPKHDDTHAARPRHRPRPQAIEKEENYRAVRHLDLGKKHLSGKKVLTETSASLGTAMLGKPAYAIVMRDGGLYRKKKRQVVTQDLRRETLDVDALLHARFDPPTNAEVRENINELRPQDSETYLKAKDFHTIQLQLEEGFLKRQLFHYLQAHRSVKSNPTAATRNVPLQRTEDEQLRLQYPWIKKVAPWTPSGRHDEVDLSDSLLLGYVSSDTTPKARAAIQLMRECWGLQIEEIAHGLGELKVGLHTSYFMPFMRDAQRFIQSISESYLEEGETIEALVDTKEIRIVAPKPKCATILAEVDSLIAKITTETIPVHHVTADVSKLTKELLEQVGRVTNTNVHLSKSRNIRVSWIQNQTSDKSETETLSHVVFRFLQNALQPDHATRTVHTANAERAIASGGGRWVVYHTKKENLALKDRLATWTRFIASAAAPLESETADTAYTPSPYPKLSMEVNLPRPAREHVQVPGEDSVECLEGQLSEVGAVSPLSTFQWSSDLSSTTSATFGHVLTLQNETVHTTPTQSPIKVNVSDIETRPHSFVPIVPHPLDLAELALPTELPDDNEITPALPIENTILIRFSINPDSAHQALPLLAPLLELRLSVSEPYSAREDPEVTGVNSLRAITTTNHNDIVLPANPVDIRITQSRDSTLQNSSGDLATWEPIAEFLAKSRLDFAAGRLDVAASQRFPIPLRLFGQAATTTHVPESDSHNRPQQPAVGADEGIEAKLQNDGDVTQTRKQEEETTSNRVRNTLYEFVGLELHRSITMPYPEDERFSLVYTSIEAGQGGGRRAELSLEPVPTSLQEAEGSVSGTTDQQDDYVRACYKMAETAKYWIGHSAAAKL